MRDWHAALYPYPHEFHFGEGLDRGSSQRASDLMIKFLKIRPAALPHYEAGRQN